MPLYEYQCDACGERFEIIQKFSDPPPDACRLCSAGPVRRLLSSPAIQFKGTGWYITDYSQKGKSSSSESDGAKPEGKAATDKGEKKSTETTASTDSAKPATPASSPAKSEG